MRKIFNFLWKLVLTICTICLLYFVVALIGSVIPVNAHAEENNNNGIKIFILNNGVHTDIAVPIETETINWAGIVNPEHTIAPQEKATYIGFGWGDLGFYKTTPQWDDLTLKTAFKALFLKTPAALHIRFYNTIMENEDVVSIEIDEQQYQKLADYLKNSFEYSKTGKIQPVPNLHYRNDDAFYRAKGSLNLFYTCNTWANEGLKAAGQKACLWTPFSDGIFFQYRKRE